MNEAADFRTEPELPAFLGPGEPLDLRPGLFGTLETAFRSQVSRGRQDGRLSRDFYLERQLQSNWCWASVGVALARFFGDPPMTQCALVQKTRNPAGTDCCRSPGSAACNVLERMSNVLDTLDIVRLAAPRQPQGPLGFELIRQDIARDAPIVCAMVDAQSGHFVVIVAWALVDGIPFVIVDDPAVGGRKERPLDRFMTDFDGRAWAQSTRLATQ